MAMTADPGSGAASTGAVPATRSTAAVWAGIVFAVTYVGGAIAAFQSPTVTTAIQKDSGQLADTYRVYYAVSSHRVVILAGAFVLLIAAISMVVFASELRARLEAAGERRAAQLAYTGATLFAAATIVGAAAVAWLPGAKTFGNSALPTGEINYLASQLGFAIMLLGGGVTAGLMLTTAGWAAARTGVLPGWLSWVSIAVGVIVFFLAAFFLPMALLVLWALVTSIVLLARSRKAN